MGSLVFSIGYLLLMVLPELITSVIGIALIVLVVFLQSRRPKDTPHAPAAPAV